MSYLILLSPVVDAQLESLRAFDHVRILEAIETNLLHQPLTATRFDGLRRMTTTTGALAAGSR